MQPLLQPLHGLDEKVVHEEFEPGAQVQGFRRLLVLGRQVRRKQKQQGRWPISTTTRGLLLAVHGGYHNRGSSRCTPPLLCLSLELSPRFRPVVGDCLQVHAGREDRQLVGAEVFPVLARVGVIAGSAGRPADTDQEPGIRVRPFLEGLDAKPLLLRQSSSSSTPRPGSFRNRGLSFGHLHGLANHGVGVELVTVHRRPDRLLENGSQVEGEGGRDGGPHQLEPERQFHLPPRNARLSTPWRPRPPTTKPSQTLFPDRHGRLRIPVVHGDGDPASPP